MSGERGGGNGEQMNSRNLEEVKLTGLSIIDKKEGGMESDSRFCLGQLYGWWHQYLTWTTLEPGRTQKWLYSIQEVRQDPKAA